ncbi:MAG: lysophospholipase [Syntrophobacterales bacterium]|jgi:fermentation-respiration switch protein FrsA (DUF1100 family)|nr:lysophospholipase [Syntrophobacterales bacterium]
MDIFAKGLDWYDQPEIRERLFFPRKMFLFDNTKDSGGFYQAIEVEDGLSITCRFYPAHHEAPNILYFHGNGEIASDYDDLSPEYTERGMNLFITDYRGYGMSQGVPSCRAMIYDAHPLFQGWKDFLREQKYTGGLYIMGRSLGSAPAIELAFHYGKELKGLIVESGFSAAKRQIRRIGMSHILRDDPNPVGFGNDHKIREINLPILIIHGEADDIIPAEEGRELYKLSPAERKERLFIPFAGHNDLLYMALDDYMTAIKTFTRAT